MHLPECLIEARWLDVPGPAHPFWLLCEDGGAAVAELHALSRDATSGEWRPLGAPVPPAAMRLVHLVHAPERFDDDVPGTRAGVSARRDGQRSEIAFRGDFDAALARWRLAACALPLLNAQLAAVGVDAAPVDSHSALATLADWMGLQAPAPAASRSVDAAARLPAIAQRVQPEPSPQSDPLYVEARDAVARMEASLGRSYDSTSERLTAALAALAREHRMAGIDHVLLSMANSCVERGQNVFVVHGEPDDPAHQRAVIRTHDALRSKDSGGAG